MVNQDKKTPPVLVGQEYTVEISGLGHSGEGVGRYQDFTIFIPGAIPSEQVRVKIMEVKKNYARGVLKAVIAASVQRVDPSCPTYNACGGCQLQHMSYLEQLNWKRQVVIDAVSRIGKLEQVVVQQTVGVDDPWYYRNKMQLPVGVSRGKVVAGCFAQGSHEIVDTEQCYIQNELNNEVARVMKSIIPALGLTVYDEKSGAGLLRHIVGRVGVKSGEVMIVLVTNGREIPQKNKLVALMREQIPAVVSIVQNINSKRTNVIFGAETHTLWGKDTITDYIGPFQFQISARSFFQVNTPQAEVLYGKALEYAALSGKETVIDAYCGTGTIALFLAQQAARVFGIEIVPEAIANARDNAELNGITNAEFMVGDAVELMPRMYEDGIKPDVIVVDPPRAGCDQAVLDTFIKLQPKRIVYVSCNPGSLARDLGYLAQEGYETKEITPVDMFPHTSHVECVVRIEKK